MRGVSFWKRKDVRRPVAVEDLVRDEGLDGILQHLLRPQLGADGVGPLPERHPLRLGIVVQEGDGMMIRRRAAVRYTTSLWVSIRREEVAGDDLRALVY